MTALLTNWNFMRIFRLGMGLWIIYSSFSDNQPLMGIVGGFFALQAILNMGCCGSGRCAISHTTNQSVTDTKDIEYEEIK